MRTKFLIISFALLGGVAVWAYFWPWALIFYALLLPLFIMGVADMVNEKQTIRRNFPLLGRLRYLMEDLRPKIYQYFVESDIDGRPFHRVERSVIYQRAKHVRDTTPFGTQMNVYGEGYEWINHSIAALQAREMSANYHPKVTVGAKNCSQPYELSLLNISAMSFGSLSKNAVMALNGGAAIGGFAHNTGEGSIAPYHTKYAGDLIFQVGTGLFGAREPEPDADGNPVFSPEVFAKNAQRPSVKMIELKLSQGAKPGHGGILPAKKNTPEIAAIRGVQPGTTVNSPPFHSSFTTPIGLLELLAQMRELSGGKPVGFKLCIGHKSEFLAICKAMVQTGITPDFISVDGGEGGTGAAPVEFSNSVGMPMRDGLAFVYDALQGFNLKQDIVLLASGKIATGFDMFRAFALGADACYSARAFMMALGCIQSLECNKNICPAGVATQKEHLVKGLVVTDKKERVANFHRETMDAFLELLAAIGLEKAEQISRAHINRNENQTVIRRYDDSYPYLPVGALLEGGVTPPEWKKYLDEARADSFQRAIPQPG